MPRDTAPLLSTAPASQRSEVQEALALNKGLLAYCSRYIEGSALAEPELLPQRPSRAFLAQAARLVMLDLLLVNNDRQIDNANALLLGDKLIAIDHGDALAGLDRPGETGTSLANKTVIPSPMKAHFLMAFLRQRAGDIDWGLIEADLNRVDQTRVTGLLEDIPGELGSLEQNNRQELYSRLRPFLLHRLRMLPELFQNLRAFIETKP